MAIRGHRPGGNGWTLPGTDRRLAPIRCATGRCRPTSSSFLLIPPFGRAEVEFETRTDDVGRDVLPAFSSVQRLVEAFGPDQPWLALKLHTARELAITNGLADILIDPVVPRDVLAVG